MEAVSELRLVRLVCESVLRQAVAKLPKILQFGEGKRLRLLLLQVVVWLISAGEKKVRRIGLLS